MIFSMCKNNFINCIKRVGDRLNGVNVNKWKHKVKCNTFLNITFADAKKYICAYSVYILFFQHSNLSSIESFKY